MLAEFQYANQPLSSVLLVADGCLYCKYRAALRIAKQLDGAWRALYYLFFWVPPFVADLVYDYIGDRVTNHAVYLASTSEDLHLARRA